MNLYLLLKNTNKSNCAIDKIILKHKRKEYLVALKTNEIHIDRYTDNRQLVYCPNVVVEDVDMSCQSRKTISKNIFRQLKSFDVKSFVIFSPSTDDIDIDKIEVIDVCLTKTTNDKSVTSDFSRTQVRQMNAEINI